jgi:poly(beta-D-mannuronate) lyase
MISMRRLFFLVLFLSSYLPALAGSIIVRNIAELNEANSKARPGDIIILKDGNWDNVTIRLDCHGTSEKIILFRSQTPGKVKLTGNSRLMLGGSYIQVEGLHFTNGFAGDDPVISFRVNAQKLANNCRVTNCAIDDFNNPRRMDENYWVAFYGKNNRLDHCSFRDKKNIGVLLAVILDDDRSRENFHRIDHNYFGRRPPLGSNGGEIIRVGVSQHCQFNSNTQITDNYFEHCDGETEIVSIKSGSNVIRGNLFRQCQGSVVLRHGDHNTVENNIFLGLDKEGTGGVRVINKGQWVVNNYFYKCRGTGFRSPLAIMNGIPNSPAHRYVQVQDAVIANNTFYECSPVSFGEGSDTERTLPPVRVLLANNIFYNSKDSIIYKISDNISGISMLNNHVSRQHPQVLVDGFRKAALSTQKNDIHPFPVSNETRGSMLPDSLQQIAQKRLGRKLPAQAGFIDLNLVKRIQSNGYYATGARWFKSLATKQNMSKVMRCSNATQVYEALSGNTHVSIILTGDEYIFHRPLQVAGKVKFSSTRTAFINFHTVPGLVNLFEIKNGGSLALEGLKLDGSDVKALHIVSNDSTGPSNHFNFSMRACSLRYFNRNYGCENLLYVYKSSVADSIIMNNCHFENNAINLLVLNNEKDNKGYYNAEKIRLVKNAFINNKGFILDIYRGGNDESTLGPDLLLEENSFENCNTENEAPLLSLTGVQQSTLFFNSFIECNPGKTLILFKDIVRARHLLSRNVVTASGTIRTNQFVTEDKNSIQ